MLLPTGHDTGKAHGEHRPAGPAHLPARQFTRILAKEFGPRRIVVNAVSPGATDTETYRDGKTPEFLTSLEAMSAFGRLGRPAEIAASLASQPATPRAG